MTDRLSKSIPLIIALIICAGTAYADFGISFDMNNSQTNNLMNDSSAINSPIRSASLGLNYYPLSQLELSSSFKYTNYDEIINTTVTGIDTVVSKTDISNSLYSFGISWIPTKAENKTSIYFKTSLDRVLYKGDVSAFDNVILGFNASIGYKFKPAVHLRAGAKITNNNYLNEDSIDGDNIQYELFSGINFSLPGSNSLDIEGGFGTSSFQFIDAIKYPTYPPDPYLAGDVNPNTLVEKGNFQSLYISPRFSRSIGKRTGISLTYTYRHFINVEDAVVLGYSTSFLSPWASFYDGSSIILRLKTYLVPKMIISVGTGYWDKKYLRTVDLVWKEMFPGYETLVYNQPEDTPYRHEWLSRVYLDVKRPLLLFGLVVEPSISIDYKNNISTSDAYDYSSTTFSFGLSLNDNF